MNDQQVIERLKAEQARVQKIAAALSLAKAAVGSGNYRAASDALVKVRTLLNDSLVAHPYGFRVPGVDSVVADEVRRLEATGGRRAAEGYIFELLRAGYEGRDRNITSDDVPPEYLDYYIQANNEAYNRFKRR
jgi:hypothetical protein